MPGPLKNSMLVILGLQLMWTVPGPVAANPYKCPDVIATIEGNYLTDLVHPVMIEVYDKLGCRLKSEPLPGRRGILYFNDGSVDGELFRAKLSEQKYERDFVRSKIPIMSINGSVWSHPEQEPFFTPIIGYTIGAVWQEKFVVSKESKQYQNAKELIEAYNEGVIQVFLATDITVSKMLKQGQIDRPPIRIQVVDQFHIYHYLGREFEDFSQKFSEEIMKENPFQNLAE